MLQYYKCPNPKCNSILSIEGSTTRAIKCPKCSHLGALSEYQKVSLINRECKKCGHSWKAFLKSGIQAPVDYICPKCKCSHIGNGNLFVRESICPNPYPNSCPSKKPKGPCLYFAINPINHPQRLTCPYCNYSDGYSKFFDDTPPPSVDNDFFLEFLRDEKNLWCDKNRRFELKDGRNTIGRDGLNSTADIKFKSNDAHISRQHIEIIVSRNSKGLTTYILKDVGKNGTCLNSNEKISPGTEYILEENDQIKMEGTIFVVKRKTK